MFQHLNRQNQTPIMQPNEKTSSLSDRDKLAIIRNTLLNPTIGGKKDGKDTEPWSAMAEFVIEAVWNDMIKSPSMYMGSDGQYDVQKIRAATNKLIRAFKLLIAAFAEEVGLVYDEFDELAKKINNKTEIVK